MSEVIASETLPQPVRQTAQNRAETTNATARAIIKAELDSRDAKMDRLKQARLAMEAQQPVVPPKTRAKAAKRTVSRRTA